MSPSNGLLRESRGLPIGNTCRCLIDEQQLGMKAHYSLTIIYSHIPDTRSTHLTKNISKACVCVCVYVCARFLVIKVCVNSFLFQPVCTSCRENERKGGEAEKGKERFKGLTWATAGWVIKFFNLDLLYRRELPAVPHIVCVCLWFDYINPIVINKHRRKTGLHFCHLNPNVVQCVVTASIWISYLRQTTQLSWNVLG